MRGAGCFISERRHDGNRRIPLAVLLRLESRRAAASCRFVTPKKRYYEERQFSSFESNFGTPSYRRQCADNIAAGIPAYDISAKEAHRLSRTPIAAY